MPIDSDLPQQFGSRAWLFTPLDTSLAAIGNSDADFYISYQAQRNGENVELGLTLNATFEYTNFALAAGLVQRKVIEDRVKQIKWSYVGKLGTLVTDSGGPTRTLNNIMLSDMQVSIDDSNQCVEYSLAFVYPLSNIGGAQIARTLAWGLISDGTGQPVLSFTADNFILINEDAGDRTTFKDVFRAAPVRIYSAPALKILRVTGILQRPTAAYGSSALAFRQGNEAVIKSWVAQKGLERQLVIDSVNLGNVHLRNVSPGTLDLPQAVLYDLEFNSGYVN